MKLKPVLFCFFLFASGLFSQTTFMIPMRDSVHLATNIYLPPDTAWQPVPLVLNRTPYGRGSGGAFMDSLLAHGIGYVSQDLRGRGNSEGEADIFLVDGWGEKQDGFDTVEWLASQSWCNGKIGLYGGSAHGITSYFCAGAAPPHLICAFVANAASDMYQHAVYPGGCYRKEQVDGWTFFQGLSHLRYELTNHYLYSPFWDNLNLMTRIPFVKIPIFHVAGWYDTFCEGNIEAFRELQAHGGKGARANQKIIIGPWTHGHWRQRKQGDLFYPENSTWKAEMVALQWFLHYLKDEHNEIEMLPFVQCYVMGAVSGQSSESANQWKFFNSWPPEYSAFEYFYLQPDQTIAGSLPQASDASLSFYHDPHAPLYCNGGRNLIWSSGPKNQFLQDMSPQNVIWTSEDITEELIIAGPVSANIFLESDCEDTDIMVRLEDVYPDGKSYLIMDGALKLRYRNGFDHEELMTPGEIYEINVLLGNIAYCFSPGHKMRVAISSALYPRYDTNANTGGPVFQKSPYKIAHNKIYCDSDHPSAIILNVLKSQTRVAENHPASAPMHFSLFQNYPNPFNQTTDIGYNLPGAGHVLLKLYDITGREIKTLVNGFQNKGYHHIKFDAGNMTSGVYFYALLLENSGVLKKKMILVK